MKMIRIKPEKIGEVIGPGGKIIRKIIEETGSDVSVEDDGTVTLTAPTMESILSAETYIQSIVEEAEVGKIYDGTVKKIMDFGAFVEILPGKEGLVHISKLDRRRVQNVTDVLNVGDSVKVKCIKIDERGRIDLSRKDAL
jgi:polyribonucleotide nucleotidyltransferase